jgi:hypothetical protein
MEGRDTTRFCRSAIIRTMKIHDPPFGILVDHVRGTLHGGVDVSRIAEARGDYAL